MMRIDILTLFPEMVDGALRASIIGRGREAGLIDIRCHCIRDYSPDKRRRTDDYPYGGGQGMKAMNTAAAITARVSLRFLRSLSRTSINRVPSCSSRATSER